MSEPLKCKVCGEAVHAPRRRVFPNVDWLRVGLSAIGALIFSALAVGAMWAMLAIVGIDPQWQAITFGALAGLSFHVLYKEGL